jgi:4-hydroxy-tetrahydrodipicolinate synthase
MFTAMVTPFTAAGEMDAQAASNLARHLREHGTGGLILAGSTGEAFSLSTPERLELYQAVREGVGRSIPV